MLFLLSVIITGIITLVLSQVVIEDEIQFLSLLNGVGYFLMVYRIFMGLISIHEYGLFKTIATIVVTGVAACIILFVGLLIFDLSQQFTDSVLALSRGQNKVLLEEDNMTLKWPKFLTFKRTLLITLLLILLLVGLVFVLGGYKPANRFKCERFLFRGFY